MKEQIVELTDLIKLVPKKFKMFSEQEYTRRPGPNKWSKKEILGHLCDSAVLNLDRFITGQIEPQPVPVKGYDQDAWVILQDYQHTPVDEIIDFWISLNKSIIRVISDISEDQYENLFKVKENCTVTFSG